MQREGRLFERRRPTFDRQFERARDRRPGAEEDVEVGVEAGVRVRDVGGLFGGAVERAPEFSEAGLRRGEVVQHRDRVFRQRPQHVDRFVEARPAPREAVAAVDEVFLARHARRLVEHVEEFIDLHRFLELRERDRRVLLEVCARVALDEFQVLESDRGSREHGRGSVHRQRLDALLELHFDDRGRASGARFLLGDDVRDDPHARAADAHVVALDQTARVRERAFRS